MLFRSIPIWKWGIPVEAVHDLRVQMGIDPSQRKPEYGHGMTTEAGVGKFIRLEVAKKGGLLWRNNVGAMVDQSGHMVRFGLANESKAINAKIKSSDYVGIMPVELGPDHIGMTIGQFIAIETKEPGWVTAAAILCTGGAMALRRSSSRRNSTSFGATSAARPTAPGGCPRESPARPGRRT